MRNSSIKNDRGFTLIELLIGLTISSIITMSLYSVFNNTKRTFSTQNDMVGTFQNLRFSMDTIVNQVRMAGYNNGISGTRSVNAITRVILDSNNNANEITFVYDKDDNGTIDDPNDYITFRLDNANDANYIDSDHRRLMRGTGAAPDNFQAIAENVNILIFTFTDSNGAGIASASLNTSQSTRDTIRGIKISLTGGTEKKDPTIGTYRTVSLNNTITPRNLSY